MHWLAEKITHFFIFKKIIQEDEKEVYVYSFEILLSTVFNIALLIAGAIITGKYYETAIFAIVFITLRKFTGGFHANTHIGCLLTLVIAYTGFVLLLIFVNMTILSFITKVCIVFYLLVVFILAPIDNHNNPIEDSQKKKYRILSIVIVSIAAIASLFSNLLFPNLYLSFSVSYSAVCVALSVIVGKVFYVIKSRKNAS